jgi:sialate O-acetylesterase
MKIPRLLKLSLALTIAATGVQAEVTLAPLFGDHAVLQRDKSVPIWGGAAAGEQVTLTFRDQTVQTTADAHGRWIVYLQPLTANAEPADLVVAGHDTVILHDIVVGEVWLASGQSNMEWPVSYLREDEKKMAAVDLPLVRQLRIDHQVAATPADSVKTSGWKPATPATVGEFTAVGYFFARELQRKLGVPVGIVHSSWGATAIDSWMSDVARQATPYAAQIEERWQQDLHAWTPERIARYPADMVAWQKAEEQAKATHSKNLLSWPQPPATPESQGRPGGIFNAMIAPLQPGAIRGIIWYQGEGNVGRPAEYAELFPAMIRSWRSNWGDDALPFYFVQLPNYADGNPGGRQWARLREAQAKALELPATGMAVAIDLGEPDNLHPTTKMELGRRLALLAKTETYRIPGDATGPVYAGITRAGSTLHVHFKAIGTGLVAYRKPPQALEIAGADKVFHVATGRIEHDALIVSSPEVKAPVAVRYAWSNAPVTNLYSGSGLPVAPFRSDDW